MVRDIAGIDSELRSSQRYSGLKNESSARCPGCGNHKTALSRIQLSTDAYGYRFNRR